MSQGGRHSGRGPARAQRRGPGLRAGGSDELVVLRAALARLQTALATAERQARVAAASQRQGAAERKESAR
jgi:hypothetical protein